MASTTENLIDDIADFTEALEPAIAFVQPDAQVAVQPLELPNSASARAPVQIMEKIRRRRNDDLPVPVQRLLQHRRPWARKAITKV